MDIPAATVHLAAVAPRLVVSAQRLDLADSPVAIGDSEWQITVRQLAHAGSRLRHHTIGDLIVPIRHVAGERLDSVAWLPGGVDPFRPRTLNLCRKHLNELTWRELAATTIDTIVSWHNAGPATVADVVRVAIEVGARLADTPDPAPAPPAPAAGSGAPILGDGGVALLMTWAVTEAGASTLGDALELARSGDAPHDIAAIAHAVHTTPLVADPAPTTRALVHRLLQHIPSDARDVYLERIASTTATFDQIAATLGISVARARSLHHRAVDIIDGALLGADMNHLRWRVHRTRAALGTFAPANDPHTIGLFGGLFGGDADPVAVRVVLCLAGPYTHTAGVYHRGPYLAMRDQIVALADHHGLYPVDIAAALADLGVAERYTSAALHAVDSHRLTGGRWVRWDGGATRKAIAVLAAAGHPCSIEEITAQIGGSYRTRSVINQMLDDDRISRVGLRRYALGEWGHEQYTTLAAKIAERLDLAGRPVPIDELAETLADRFGVSVNSVRTGCRAAGFVVENGTVRRRVDADGAPVVDTDISRARGAYRTTTGITLTITADQAAVRGSGRTMSAAVAASLGARPGHDARFADRYGGTVTVSWPLDAPHPSLTSIRALIRRTGGDMGDLIRLEFNVVDNRIDVHLADDDGGDPLKELAEITGIGANDPTSALEVLVAALDSTNDDVDAVLRVRNDQHLNALVDRLRDAAGHTGS